jgi:hypothetical protein
LAELLQETDLEEDREDSEYDEAYDETYDEEFDDEASYIELELAEFYSEADG